jgi:hypothetical protein
VAGIQHAKGASWEEERGDNTENEMQDESGRVLAKGNENMRAPFASPSQDVDQPTSTGPQVLITSITKYVGTYFAALLSYFNFGYSFSKVSNSARVNVGHSTYVR